MSQAIDVDTPSAITDQNRSGPLPYASSIGSSIESVNMSNGNLSVRIPLVNIKSRGINYALTLMYDGNFWTPMSIPTSNGELWANENRLYIPGLVGWSLNQPFLEYSASEPDFVCDSRVEPPAGSQLPTSQGFYYSNYIFTDEQGSKHSLDVDGADITCVNGGGDISFQNSGPDKGQAGLKAEAITGSASPTLSIATPSGSVYSTGGSSPNDPTIYNLGSGLGILTDVSGNSEEIYPGGSDTIGRIPLTLTQDSATQFHYTYNDPNGNPQEILVELETVDISTDFDVVQSYDSYPIYEAIGTIQTIKSIRLPNGTSYSFTYDNYGEITSIALPTGGSISYQWSTLSNNESSYRYVSQRTTNDGTNQATWNISIATAEDGAETIVTLTDPTTQQNQSVYTTGNGVTSDVKVYAGSASGNPVRHYQISYVAYGNVNTPQTAYTVSGPQLPSQIITTNDIGQVNELDYDYDIFTYQDTWCNGPPSTSCAYDGPSTYTVTASRGDVKAIRQYDWGNGTHGALLRQTLKTYLHEVNSAYANLNIVDRVATDSVYDGSQICYGGQTCSANLLAETSYSYDQGYSQLRGLVTEVSRWVNTSGSTVANTYYTYDNYGNVLSVKDPNTNLTTWGYTNSWATGKTSCFRKQPTHTHPAPGSR
jgi:YD repeat-containing protein